MAKRKFNDRELSIEDAISEAFGELQSLGEEMREAFDNTPESLQNSGVGEARGEAADALENISEPDIPTELQGDKFKVKWQVHAMTPKQQMKQSRSARRDDALATLNAVAYFLDQIDDEENSDAHYSDEEKEAASTLVDEVRQMIDEAESVDFPGMFG